MRSPNTNTRGGAFNPAEISAVWVRGQIVAGYDPSAIRKDACGAWMKRAEYGMTTQYGWEIDHVRPVACGGGDEIANLQPLYWENNRFKSDSWPNWTCRYAAA